MCSFPDKLRARLDSRDIPADHTQPPAEVTSVSVELDIALEATRIKAYNNDRKGEQGWARYIRNYFHVP